MRAFERFSRRMGLSLSVGVLGLLTVLLYEMAATLAARPGAWAVTAVIVVLMTGLVAGSLRLTPAPRARPAAMVSIVLARTIHDVDQELIKSRAQAYAND